MPEFTSSRTSGQSERLLKLLRIDGPASSLRDCLSRVRCELAADAIFLARSTKLSSRAEGSLSLLLLAPDPSGQEERARLSMLRRRLPNLDLTSRFCEELLVSPIDGPLSLNLFGALVTRSAVYGAPFAALIVSEPFARLQDSLDERHFTGRGFWQLLALFIESRINALRLAADEILSRSILPPPDQVADPGASTPQFGFETLEQLKESIEWSSAAYGPREFSEAALVAHRWNAPPGHALVEEILTHLRDEWRRHVDGAVPPARPAKRDLGLQLINLSKWLSPPPSCEAETCRKALNEFRTTLPELVVSEVSPKEDLSGSALGSYFLSRALTFSPAREQFWASQAPSGGELFEALTSVSRYAHHCLAQFPLDQATIQSAIWMLSEYAHRELRIPEQIDLRTHLLLAAREEPALHALKSYYRNHFFHAIEVCFLGHFLLDLEIEPGKPLWMLVAERCAAGARRDLRDRHAALRQWYLASLLHDVGYAVEVAKGLCHLTRTFGKDDPLATLAEGVEQAMKRVSKQLAVENFLNYADSDNVGEDHGVVCARHVQRMLEEIGKQDPKVDPASYSPAVAAIGHHNSRKHKVSFDTDPLGFLLILCDTLQEWNRPYLPYSTAPLQIMTWLMGNGNQDHPEGEKLQRFTLNAANHPRGFRLEPHPTGAGKPLFHFSLEYGDGVRNNNGVFYLWLDASLNFQRLDFENCPFDIDVSFITPQHLDRRTGNPESNMHRLRDAARETHMSFLYQWFPDRDNAPSGTTNGAVEHTSVLAADGKSGWDTVTLHLRELSRRKRILKDISTISKELAKWRRVSEDQVFPWEYANPDAIGV